MSDSQLHDKASEQGHEARPPRQDGLRYFMVPSLSGPATQAPHHRGGGCGAVHPPVGGAHGLAVVRNGERSTELRPLRHPRAPAIARSAMICPKPFDLKTDGKRNCPLDSGPKHRAVGRREGGEGSLQEPFHPDGAMRSTVAAIALYGSMPHK